MPTIINTKGLKIAIFPGDHLPAHVHVRKAEGKAKIELKSLVIMRSEGMNPKQLKKY